ncbi:hypothetical protein [Streptomyces sp. NPDC049879]|uniref:hypothetical protein n=1 Tax=Streptomyces sp. NPDC049879 TaxID=3365598 RepID=UPI0037BBC0E3
MGAELNGVPLRVSRVRRVEAGDAAAGQPVGWTLLDFAADERDAARLADGLAAALSPTGGWYADFHTADETFVVFAGKVFRYPRGQEEGRRRVQEHGRAVGVPERQLDWAR